MDIEDNITGHKGWRLFAHLTNQQIDEVKQSTLLNPHRHQFFFMEQTQSLSSENSKACKKIDVILSKQLLDHLDIEVTH